MTVPTFVINATECSELAVRFVDDASRRAVAASAQPVAGGVPVAMPRGVILWRDDAYDAAGDYTQADVEQRLLEVLGDLSTAFN